MAMIATKSNELTHIQSFLYAHGWKKQGQSKYFDCYTAPTNLKLPADYLLEIPRDTTDKGYNRYTEGLIDILHDLYGEWYNVQTIQTFFSTNHFILSLQLEDADTEMGKIQLERLKILYDTFFNALKKMLIFDLVPVPIFAKVSPGRITPYLDQCKALQTVFGSYGVKMEMPEFFQSELFNPTQVIPKQFLEVLEFLIRSTQKPMWNRIYPIDKTFVQQNKAFMNVEMLDAMVRCLKEPAIKHLTVRLDNNRSKTELQFRHIDKLIPNMSKMVSLIKKIVLQENPLELHGTITRLTSKNATLKGSVLLEGVLSDEKIAVEIMLFGADYAKAVEAHGQGRTVFLKGIAKAKGTNHFSIEKKIQFDFQEE
jgi:hypothetical protein